MWLGVYWLDFSWEAFATLAAGLAAVIAAWKIGNKQVKIQDRQIKIQADAIIFERNIRDLELRCLLLDRRFDCIERVRQARSTYIGSSSWSLDEKIAFYDAIRQAELIFPRDVVERLRSVLSDIEAAESAARVAESARIRGNQDELSRAVDIEIARSQAVWDALPTLEAELVAAARIELL